MEPTNLAPTSHEKDPFDPRSIPASIITAGLLIAGSILFVGFRGIAPSSDAVQAAGTKTAPSAEISLKPVSDTDHIRGDKSARFILVEFSDLECPYCKVFHSTLKRLMDEYGSNGTFAWVYRNFPIDSLHSKARGEAVSAECAAVVGGNDKYWNYIDEVFARTNSNNSLDPAQLPRIAKDIGLDAAKFDACVKANTTASKIEADIVDGTAAGLKGTPYSVLIDTKTGKKTPIEGAQSYEVLKQKIEGK